MNCSLCSELACYQRNHSTASIACQPLWPDCLVKSFADSHESQLQHTQAGQLTCQFPSSASSSWRNVQSLADDTAIPCWISLVSAYHGERVPPSRTRHHWHKTRQHQWHGMWHHGHGDKSLVRRVTTMKTTVIISLRNYSTATTIMILQHNTVSTALP